jgi:hypothetical protein
MPVTEKRKGTMMEYAKKNLKRVPLDVQKEHYERIKAHAEGRGETVNGFIKRAIDEIMYEEGERAMIDIATVERRYRYRLKLHGLSLHKVKNDYGDPVYYLTDEGDDTRPDDDDPNRWFSFDQLSEYCAKLAEKDAEYFAEQREKRLGR